MYKVFVSYHHALDQAYKEDFVTWAVGEGLMVDYSVNTGEIDDTLEPQKIREIIRDNYLRDTEITVLLCGAQTRFRKHVDWELKSTMINGSKNARSGILVVDLPTSDSNSWNAPFPLEKDVVYPDYSGGWTSVKSVDEETKRYPNMPRRILENIVRADVRIPIVPWDRLYRHRERLDFLFENTRAAGPTNVYDLSRKMRMRDYNPAIDAYDVRV